MTNYPKQLESNYNGERWRLAGNELISHVHSVDACDPPCTLHAPTDHHMRAWRLHYRHDREMFERICEHGVGHPDPDTRRDGGVHGCDLCCREPADV